MEERKKHPDLVEGKTRRSFTMPVELVDYLLQEAKEESELNGQKVTMTDLVIRSIYMLYPEAPKYKAKTK